MKRAYALANGADAVIDPYAEDAIKRVGELTGGEGPFGERNWRRTYPAHPTGFVPHHLAGYKG